MNSHLLSEKEQRQGLSFHFDLTKEGSFILTIDGRLDSNTTGKLWQKSAEALQQAKPERVVVDASAVQYCDGSGIGFLLDLRCRQRRTGGTLEINGLKSEFKQLLDLFDPVEFEEPLKSKAKQINLPEEVGRAVFNLLKDARMLITFSGELVAALVHAALNPRRLRWKDTFQAAEAAGVNALPIIALISFLMGLIMAFQSAIPMRQFGAEILVANLVSLSMVRELGPLMTAIVLAGRTGSAFAAEIGTMKVNEEIDALTTMGLDPVRFLVVTRVIAAIIMTPLLTVFANLLGIMGGSIVILSFGYPLIAFFNQVVASITYVDLLGGLIKAFIFGIMVAGIGTLRGLQTKTGASAVGVSTTRAVVSGIILIVITDGVFSVLYYYIGI